MVQAFVTTTTEEPTGPGPWDYLLEGLDLNPDTIVARWDMDTFEGAYVGAWRAAESDLTLNGAAAAVGTTNGHRYARFDSEDDYVSLSLSGLGVKTVGVLVRRTQTDVGGVPLSFGPAYVNYYTNGSLGIVGGTAQSINPTRPTNAWHWLWVSFDGTTRRVAINGENPAQTSASQTALTKIELGRAIEGGSYGGGPSLIAGVVALNAPISQSQRADVWAATAAARPEWAA